MSRKMFTMFTISISTDPTAEFLDTIDQSIQPTVQIESRLPSANRQIDKPLARVDFFFY